jgi:hypothetical protein
MLQNKAMSNQNGDKALITLQDHEEQPYHEARLSADH